MRKIKFSREEITDLIKAWLAISIAFGIVLGTAEIWSIDFIYSFVLNSRKLSKKL